MNLQPDRITLRPLAAQARDISRLRLAQSAQGLELAMSATPIVREGPSRTTFWSLRLAPTEGQPVQLFSIEHLLPGAPAWDLAFGASGDQRAFVMDQALGATHATVLRDFDQRTYGVPAVAGLRSHRLPSFVQRRGNDATARIVTLVDEREAVLFEREANGPFRQRSVLCDCEDARLMPWGDGYLLWTKRYLAGPVRGGSIPRGSLHVQPMNARFEPTGPEREPFADLVVYEFAVDATAERMALLLTTGNGTLLVQARQSAGPWLALGIHEDANGATLRSPTLSLAADATAIALLDEAPTHKRILFGGTKRAPPPP